VVKEEEEELGKEGRKLPGPWKWPIWGNLPGLLRAGGLFEYLRKMEQRYGYIYRVCITTITITITIITTIIIIIIIIIII